MKLISLTLNTKPFYLSRTVAIASIALLTLSGCESDSDSDSSSSGYVNLYNVSANSPEIYLTLDEDLDEDYDDEVEITYPSIEYTDSSGIYSVEDNKYFMELAWQDEDSSDRDDLTLIYQDQIEIVSDQINFIVVSEDITSPNILNYSIDIIDDDDDYTDDLFNMRILNMHPKSEGLDLYISESDETFNEAVLIGSYAYTELSDNQKFDQDEYIFYITDAGSDDVIYESQELSFPYSSQYVISIRPYIDSDESTFVIDKISLSSIIAYPDANADANYKVFNAIRNHDLLTTYQGSVDFFLDAFDDSANVENINQQQFSQKQSVDKGDYSVTLTVAGTEDKLLNNHLLTLPENSNKSIFFYLDEDEVDHDGDGNVDEDGDGIVDEIEITINSLVVDNSTGSGIYDHEIKMINLVDNDDFHSVNFYFVRNDELVETTPYYRTASYANSTEIDLVNNTYQVFAIATENSSELILAVEDLVLNEQSQEMFLILEEDEDTPSGYRMTFAEQ